MHKDMREVLITEEEIISRIKELGKEISDYYRDKEPVIVVGLLKGSVPFMAELIKHIDLDIEIDFMDVSSYVGTESQSDVRINKDLDRSINDCHVLLVEDIVDTGKTLARVKEMMHSKGAEDVKIVTLLNKEERREVEIHVDYVGFEVPNEFVVGFGLDFNQKYRNLPYIGVLKEECYK